MELTTLLQKKGAIDAISLIIDSRNREILVKKKSEDKPKTDQEKDSGKNDSNGGESSSSSSAANAQQSTQSSSSSGGASNASRLNMPKNIHEIDADEERARQDAEEQQGKDGKDSDRKDMSKIEDDEPLIIDSDEIKKDIQEITNDIKSKQFAKERAAKAAKEKEAKAFAAEHAVSGFEDFQRDIRHALNKQINVARNTEDDFRKYNPTYHNSDFLMPGQAYPDKRSIPIINVYFDMSGSWNFRDTEKGREALKFLDNLQTRKKLKYKLYYFANNIYDNPDSARKETGTHAFPKIIEHIQATRADNVVIFTDDDFDDQTHDLDKLPYLKLKGGAWWLWRRGIRARRAFKHIQGSRPENTFQYSFTPQ